MNKLLTFFIAVIVGLWLVAMYQTKFGQDTLTNATTDVIAFGVTNEYPFAYKENNQHKGFDVELIYALTNRIGKKALLKTVPREQLFTHIIDGNVQSVTHDSAPFLDTSFLRTHAYLEPGQRFFIMKKHDHALHTLINNALDEMKEDGTLTSLQKKWNVSLYDD